MTVRFTPKHVARVPNLVAEARLVFGPGPLEGLTLEGFAIWKKKGTEKLSCTFPSTMFKGADGKTKYHWILRSTDPEDEAPTYMLRARIVKGYEAWLARHGEGEGIAI